ncbi:hypothetical protein DUI87_02900 [Hirundo rustica rustica]|uniref:Reverse transcriptase domain-containing protein n=1 Tax=Hirundo rustica rustica TaxID=333673 RepID=A0A3M0L943_HIRRU|nr:hypothetical protein DUI87_02900 [Hirundo rustica rustica]
MWRSRAVFSKQTPRFSLLLEPVLKAQDSIYSTNRTDDWGYKHHEVTLGQGETPENLQYIDDIIVWGNTAIEVFEKGEKIIQILLKASFAIKKSKVKGPAREI